MNIDQNDIDAEEIDVNASEPEGDEPQGAEGDEKPDRGDHFDPDAGAKDAGRSEGGDQGGDGKDGDGGGTGGDGDDAGETGDDEGGNRIPQPRFNEVIKQRDAEREARIRAEERNRVLEELMGKSQGGGNAGDAEDESPAIDLNELRRQRADALIDGDVDLVNELDQKIEDEISERAAARAIEQMNNQQVQSRFKSVAAESYEKFPFLNLNGPEPNEDAIREVVEWRDFYYSKGKPLDQALAEAVAKVGPLYAKAAPAAIDGQDGGGKAGERTREAISRNANMRQPPRTSEAGAGDRSEGPKVPNINDLSDEEFEALSDKEKAQLRGDTV